MVKKCQYYKKFMDFNELITAQCTLDPLYAENEAENKLVLVIFLCMLIFIIYSMHILKFIHISLQSLIIKQ